MKQILLIIPFWNVENQKERSENINFCYKAWNDFSDFCRNKRHGVSIIIRKYNLGEHPHPDHPYAQFISHEHLTYRFEKPTRMNRAFGDIFLDHPDISYAGMVDPDIIILPDQFNKLYQNILTKLSPDTMLTYGFSRTKPELREYLNHETHTINPNPLLAESDPYYERMPFAGGLFFIHLNSFINCGGFNQNFRVYGFDDVEFTNRWKMNGNKVSCTHIKLYHLWHPTVLATAGHSEIERYSYELKYWRKCLSYFQKWERLKKKYPPLRYISPIFQRYGIFFAEGNTIPFDYNYGKVDLLKFPKYILKSWGLIPNDESFYNEKLKKSLK